MITHNLNPDILTPDIFAVILKTNRKFPEHFLEEEITDEQLLRDDIRHFLLRAGFSAETVDKLYGISEWRATKDILQEQLNDH